MNKKNDFSIGSVSKTITGLAIPMIGAQLVNALYNIVDRIYIGHIPGIGNEALTGVGVTFPIIMIVSAFAALAGMGGAPLASIARGENNDEGAEKVLGNAFTMLLFFGVVLTAAGLVLKGPALILFGASEKTFPYANEYISIYLIGSIFVMIALGLNPFINSQGFAKTGMMTVAIGALANIILDPVLMFVLHMGVKGAAIATVLSQLISAIWAYGFLISKRAILRIKREHMKPDTDIIKRICALGLSMFIMQVTESILLIVTNATLKNYGGDLYLGIMTIISSIVQVVLMPLTGFAQGAQPVIGYNYGARLYGRVKQGVHFLMIISMVYSLAVWILILAFPGALIRIFNSEPMVIREGIPIFRTYFAVYIIMGLQISTQQSFVALNKAKHAIFFALLRKAVLLIPLILIMPRLYGLGANGVFLAEPIADTISAISCFITFLITFRTMMKQ